MDTTVQESPYFDYRHRRVFRRLLALLASRWAAYLQVHMPSTPVHHAPGPFFITSSCLHCIALIVNKILI